MDVNLPADVVDYLNQAVAKGAFASHADAISVAVRTLQASAWHRTEVLEGLAAISRGDYQDYDDDGLAGLIDEISIAGGKILGDRKDAT